MLCCVSARRVTQYCRSIIDTRHVADGPLSHTFSSFIHFCSGTISTASFLDSLLGRLSAIFRGELLDGINDHGASEYIRLFKQVVINSRVPLLDKAVSAFNDGVGSLILKVGG